MLGKNDVFAWVSASREQSREQFGEDAGGVDHHQPGLHTTRCEMIVQLNNQFHFLKLKSAFHIFKIMKIFQIVVISNWLWPQVFILHHVTFLVRVVGDLNLEKQGKF